MRSDRIVSTITEMAGNLSELYEDHLTEESDIIKGSISKLKKTKKDTEVSFNHWKQGKVTGKYKGLGKMGGRTYAKVCTDTATHWVPVHHINEEVKHPE